MISPIKITQKDKERESHKNTGIYDILFTITKESLQQNFNLVLRTLTTTSHQRRSCASATRPLAEGLKLRGVSKIWRKNLIFTDKIRH